MLRKFTRYIAISALLVFAGVLAIGGMLAIGAHAQVPTQKTTFNQPATQLKGVVTQLPGTKSHLSKQSYQASKSVRGIFTQYGLKSKPTINAAITKGQDGALWFTEVNTHKIGRMTTTGWTTEFQLSSTIIPYKITTGADGSLWFNYEQLPSSPSGIPEGVGRLTTSGDLTLFLLPASSKGVSGLVKGSNGAIWFGDTAHEVNSITNSGTLTQYTINGTSGGITVGYDNALWFTEENQNIGRLTTTGNYSEISVPGALQTDTITAGPNNAVWFTDGTTGILGQIITNGTVTTYSNTVTGSGIAGSSISYANNGGLVFTTSAPRPTARASVLFYVPGHTGKIYQDPDTGTDISSVVATSSGVLWMAETNHIDTFTFQH